MRNLNENTITYLHPKYFFQLLIELMEKPRKVTQHYQVITSNGITCNLGFGAYGTVMLAKCLRTGQTVAIKRILRKMAKSEASIHFTLKHPNIIKMIDYFYDQQQSTTYIVLEYASNGTLFEYMRQNQFKERKVVRNIFRSVCEAVNYLHKNNIMHRDIKPENILLDEQLNVKLCDFGFASNVEPRKTLCGTVQYMAPQMILKKNHNHKVDIWSLGILLFQLIQGHAPFQGQTQEQILMQMEKPLYFSGNFLNHQIQIVHNILKVNPNERPEACQILKFGWSGFAKTLSEETSKRSTVEDQRQSKIKILNVKQIPNSQIPNQVNMIRSIKSQTEAKEVYIETQTNQKFSLKKKWRKS